MKLNFFLFITFLFFNIFASEEPKKGIKRKAVEIINEVDKKYKNADGSASASSEIMLEDKLSNLIEKTYSEQTTFPTDISEMIIDLAEPNKFFEIATIKNVSDNFWPCSIAWSPDGCKIASLGCARDFSIKIWDVFNGEKIKDILIANNETGKWLKWKNNSELLLISYCGNVICWNIQNDTKLIKFCEKTDKFLHINECSFNPVSNEIARIFGSNFLDLFPGLITIKHYCKITNIAWSNDGTTLAIGDENGRIFFRDQIFRMKFANMGISIENDVMNGSVNDLFWTHDDKKLISVSVCRITIWDFVQLISRKYKTPSQIVCAALSPDSKFLAYSTIKSKSVKFWDIENDRLLLFNLTGFESDISCIKWSPNGKQIAVGSSDNTIKIWGKTFA